MISFFGSSLVLFGVLQVLSALALESARDTNKSGHCDGVPGIPGSPGSTGPAGSPGRDGRDGRDGRKGEKGEIGIKGVNGLPDVEGRAGSDGLVGVKGERGVSGVKGVSGKTGPQGRKGEKGEIGMKGVRGVPGVKGGRGKTGPQGPQGTRGLKGSKGEFGGKGDKGEQSQQLNWKQCVWNKDDGKDKGLIQECRFRKRHGNTALNVAFAGNLRCHGNGCCSRWFFTFNNQECTGPMTIEGIVHLIGNDNPHRHRQIEGYCENIPAGEVRVGFHIGQCSGFGVFDGSTGWNSVSRIMIAELPPPQQ